MGKLNVAKIRSLRTPGRYGDGGTLFLVVSPGGTKSFVQRLTIQGVRRDIGLGAWPYTTLLEAREAAFENRCIARKGGDPRQPRRDIPTFREAAETKHAELAPSWRSEKHAESWLQQLKKHAYPVLADMPVDRIKPSDVLRVLTPIWNVRQETARRVRRRIHTVLSWCEAHQYVDRNVAGESIAGALHRQGGKQEHLRSLPYADVPEFVRALESGPGSLVNKLCLLFTILTAVRGNEAREARWEEIHLNGRMWRIPGVTDEDGQGPRSAAVAGGAPGAETGSRLRQRIRFHLSVAEQASPAVEQRGVHEPPQADRLCRSHDRPRVPSHLPHVGERVHQSLDPRQEDEHRAQAG